MKNINKVSSVILILIFALSCQLYAQNVNDFIVEGNSDLENDKLREAVEHFDKAIELDRNSSLAYYGKGVAYDKLAKFDTALYYFRKSIKYKNDFGKAHFMSGLIRYKLKLFSKCIHDFDMAVKYDRQNTDAINLRAFAKDRVGLYESAAIDFRILSEKIPENRKFPLLLGISLIKMDSLHSGIVQMNNLICQYPDYDTAYFYRGMAEHLFEKYDSALVSYSKVLELNPKYFEAMNFRGRCLQERDSTSEENDDLRNWKLIRPDGIQYYTDLGYDCFYNSDFRNSILHFRKVLSLDSNNADAYYNIANAYFEMDYNTLAIFYENKALEINPEKTDANFIKLKAHYWLYYTRKHTVFYDLISERYGFYYQRYTLSYQNHIDSLEYLSEIILKEDPFNHKCYRIMGDLYRHEDEFKKSLNNYNKALEISQEPIVYYLRSILHYWDDNHDEALGDIDKARELDPDDIDYILTRANYLTDRGDAKEANRIFDELIETQMDLSQIYYIRGLIKYEISKNFRAAILDYDKAIEIDPYYAIAYLYRSTAKKDIDDEAGSKVDYQLYEKYRGRQ